MNAHSASTELATLARKTLGVIPPKLVGASTTVVGNKMYLFGGRLVSERRMLSDLYAFDMETLTWEKKEVGPGEPVPGPRYFHSADAWNNYLIVFGGMGYKTVDQAQESLCVLNDVCFYSIAESRWLAVDEPPSPTVQPLVPRARYAHLSSVSADMLFIIGGQDLSNGWLDDIHLYDLPSRTWVKRSDYPRHCGTYRSVAISSSLRVRDPSNDPPPKPVSRLKAEDARSVLPITPSESLVEMPYTCDSTPDAPSDIFLYSNYNFTEVKRELEIFTPQRPSSFTVTDRSDSMTGSSLPPGLRFPTGVLLGNSLIIAGTYLAHSYQAFSIWSLDLTSMQWSRIEPGTALATGSWCRAVLWREYNKLLVFGNRDGNLVEDYNHRLLSWDHVAYIDLEAFGIYQPPIPPLGRIAQEVGLVALEDGALADFEVICDDGRRIPCSRKILEERWPWFRNQRQLFVASAEIAASKMDTSSVPELPTPAEAEGPSAPRPDPRLAPRTLQLPEPFPIALAFLQYLYTQNLITPLQQAPPVLSALMLLGTIYEMGHLRDLVKHAMHRALSVPGNQNVSGVYDVATLCDCQSLRLRAMRLIKVSKRSPGRSRQPHERHGGGGSSSGRSPSHHHARPRGMSDATQFSPSTGGSGGSDQTNGASNMQTSGVSQSPAREESSSFYRLSEKHGSTELDTVSEDPEAVQEQAMEYSEDEDDDYIDPELLVGLEALPLGDDFRGSSGVFHRVSRNARPSSLQRNIDMDQDEYFFGTQPDHSPLTSTFPQREGPQLFHLPYSISSRPSRSASISDTFSCNDTRSAVQSSDGSLSGLGSLSSSEAPSSPNSNGPLTPLTPALAEIVDAVAKANVALPLPEIRLSRQPSLQSIDEHDSFVEKDYSTAETTSVSTSDEGRSLRIDTTISSSKFSLTSLESTPSPAHSLNHKHSFGSFSLSDRRSSINPLSRSGGLSRLFSPKRNTFRLEQDLAKARSKAEKLEQKAREQSEKENQQLLEQNTGRGTQSSIWNKFTRTEEKKRKKGLDNQKISDIMEESKSRADRQGSVGQSGEKFTVPAVGGL